MLVTLDQLTNTPTQSGSGYSSTVQWIYNVPNFFPIYRRNADGSYLTDANGGNNLTTVLTLVS